MHPQTDNCMFTVNSSLPSKKKQMLLLNISQMSAASQNFCQASLDYKRNVDTNRRNLFENIGYCVDPEFHPNSSLTQVLVYLN
jgi:hypothetical protein